ncbi:MAG TPA: hypothetical protein VIN02_00705 [Sulfurovum sp.]
MTIEQLLSTPQNPVKADNFIEKFKSKYNKWNAVTTPELETTWKLNCQILNHAINHPEKNIKYIVSAPTGSAKTENLITYCSMLPKSVTALISTNLIDEAENIAKKINAEAGETVACAFHSSNKISPSEAADYQIVVTTHAFYKNHYTGGDIWSILGEDRNLLVVDEAIDTMKEISVEDAAITRAITIFSHLGKQKKFKSNPRFAQELKDLKGELKILENSDEGTNLISSDKMWKLADGTAMLSLTLRKYIIFSEILCGDSLGGETSASLRSIGKATKYYHILTGINDQAMNKEIKDQIKETINNLNQLRDRQVYITANNGNKSFNRVTDMIFKKALVCFDATASVNKVYSLRAEHYGDIDLVEKVEGVRNYANVTMYTTTGETGKKDIDIKRATDILNSVNLGKKTLIVTHKQNREYFTQAKENLYPEKTIEVAHWNAITGLNKWKDFDTCIVAGLNNKPKSFAQNRTIINTKGEKIAFGPKQQILNTAIEDSTILVEIIQAINRIRIRNVIDDQGNCDKADIYMILPRYKELDYKKVISDEMPNIVIKDWSLSTNTPNKKGDAHADIVIEYLKNNLKDGEQMAIYDVRDKLNINRDSYKSMFGSSKEKQEAFEERLKLHGLEIIKLFEKDSRGRERKTPTKYYRKIESSPIKD